MHAAIHADLKTYLVEEHSQDAFDNILRSAGFSNEYFESAEYFQDTELEVLLNAAANELNMTRDEILLANGIKAAPGLMEAFKSFMQEDWNTLDLVEAVELNMHKYAREEMAAFPPVLKTERVSDTELIVNVRSHRKMWALAQGFITGFAKSYGDKVDLKTTIDGTNCRFEIKVTS